MAVEKREIRTGEHFIGDASDEIVRILSRVKEIDPRTNVDGKYLEFMASVQDRDVSNPTWIIFVEKDIPHGDIKRKVALQGFLRYKNTGHDKKVTLKLTEHANESTALEVETVSSQSWTGSDKEIYGATLIKRNGVWEIDLESLDHSIRGDDKEDRLTHLTPSDVIAGIALEEALKLAQAAGLPLVADIGQQIRRERTAKEKIAELLG